MSDKQKQRLGQFYTRQNTWLTTPVLDFIQKNLPPNTIVLDPFAGEGHLLKTIQTHFPHQPLNFAGLDINPELKQWPTNDSLSHLPLNQKDKYFFITNPPYLSKVSCKRKKYMTIYQKYFAKKPWQDLYLIALHKMIATNQPGVAIVPETFINNTTFNKDQINRIIIIEDNPFNDTEIPICVVCFNGSPTEKQIIYKNNQKVGPLSVLEKLKPTLSQPLLKDLQFNNFRGPIALKAIDYKNPSARILFLPTTQLNYDLSQIKHSSRAITVLHSAVFALLNPTQLKQLIQDANDILNEFRQKTQDVLLSPFKGNNNHNQRRRRLDFTLARNIIEKAYLLQSERKEKI